MMMDEGVLDPVLLNTIKNAVGYAYVNYVAPERVYTNLDGTQQVDADEDEIAMADSVAHLVYSHLQQGGYLNE